MVLYRQLGRCFFKEDLAVSYLTKPSCFIFLEFANNWHPPQSGIQMSQPPGPPFEEKKPETSPAMSWAKWGKNPNTAEA